MNLWTSYPFLRYLLFFIPGIIVGLTIDIGITVPLACLLLSFIVFVLIRFNWKNSMHLNTTQILVGSAIAVIIFSTGACIAWFSDHQNHPSHIIHQQNINGYTAKIISQEGESGKFYKYIAEARSILNDDTILQTRGKIILYVFKNNTSEKLRKNALVLIKGSPEQVPPPSNPGTFDYRKYLWTKNIYQQHYVFPKTIKNWGYDEDKNLYDLSYKLRKHLLNTLQTKFKDPKNYSVASALLLGDKSLLPSELRNAYASAGAMHILAVSGLHVGIIMLCISFLLSGLPETPLGKSLKALIVIGLLWTYAFITGLSPSVLRAVTMLSFLQLGITFFRSSSVLNNIGMSAFVLLIINPLNLLHIGFQLSYAAVTAIVTLHPLLFNAFTSRFWLVNKSWETISVSLAAQTGTLVPCLFYFNQFPVYFLLTNLLITLPVFVTVFIGFLILVVSLFWQLSSFFYDGLEYLIICLNFIIENIEKLPGSLLSNIYLTPTEAFLGLGFLITTCFFVYNKKFIFIKYAAILCAALISFRGISHYINAQQKGIIVWDTPGYYSFALINGSKSIAITNHPNKDYIKDLANNFLIRNNRQYTLYSIEEALTLQNIALHPDGNNVFLAWKGRTYIIGNRPKSLPGKILENTDVKIISNGRKPEAGNNKFYNTSSKGAYIEYFQ
ncbi:ComEC/Rec2 family competence protein [Cytophagaceae bacterium ABcell3]|nr:ComEC/Rec2 family competence protein [Cytophagaceae bacterium ABcell3]